MKSKMKITPILLGVDDRRKLEHLSRSSKWSMSLVVRTLITLAYNKQIKYEKGGSGG